MINLTLRRVTYCFSNPPKYKAQLEKYYRKNEYIQGYCTSQKSLKYRSRNEEVDISNWKQPKGIKQKLSISSVGIGTYNGQPSNEYDYEMFRAIVDTIKSGGVNVIDTDPLYRYGKSEKVVNAALNYLINQEGYDRSQFLISSKCGYIPRDIDSNLQEKDFIRILQKQNIVESSEIVNDVHCVDPNFLQFSLEKTRLAMGLETIDVLYLNNFSEAHLPIVGQEVVFERLQKAFSKFQNMRRQNRIKYYGICSYVGLRSPKTETGIHFNLQRAINIAKQVGGKHHGFRFLMIPFSLGTPQALLKWQQYSDGTSTKEIRVFDIAQKQNINIVICSPLFQGRVVNVPFQNKKLDYLQHTSARHLQLIRSFFSPAVLTTLVGQTQEQHIQQNLTILKHPRLSEQEWKNILPVPQ